MRPKGTELTAKPCNLSSYLQASQTSSWKCYAALLCHAVLYTGQLCLPLCSTSPSPHPKPFPPPRNHNPTLDIYSSFKQPSNQPHKCKHNISNILSFFHHANTQPRMQCNAKLTLTPIPKTRTKKPTKKNACPISNCRNAIKHISH